MRRHRELLLLGALSLGLGVGAAAAMAAALESMAQVARYWESGPVTAQPGDAEFEAINGLQRLSEMLVAVTPWLVVAAIIPAVGAMVLLTVRAQLAGVASATAARVASSAAAVSAGSADANS